MKQTILDLFAAILPENVTADLAVPDLSTHGHYTSSIALKLAKERKQSPVVLAEALKHQLLDKAPKKFFDRIEVVPPGFLNMWISADTLRADLQRILKDGAKYGRSRIGKGQKAQVEFISANPTGPLTLANGRGGFLGDVLANVLEATGHSVEREYYVNDTGGQMRTLGLSVLAAATSSGTTTAAKKKSAATQRVRATEAADNQEVPLYRGDHITVWAKAHKTLLAQYKDDPETLGKLVAKDFLAQLVKPSVAKAMRIRFDRWTSEANDISKKGWPEQVAKFFGDRGLSYRSEGAIWLRTTQFADDKDRVLVKSDGSPTYFLNDAGHYLETAKRGFSWKINILGADHHGYVSRIQAVAQMVGLPRSTVLVVQLMRLTKNGEVVRMSKRRGAIVTMDDLVREVGSDVARFFFLLVTPNKAMDFDIGLAKERSLKNPVFYVQYAYVRGSNILKKAKLARSGASAKVSAKQLAILNTPEDIELLRTLARYPELLAECATDLQVTRLTRYARDLAEGFHSFYEKEHVAGEEKDIVAARAALVRGTLIVLENLFSVLGVSAPKKM